MWQYLEGYKLEMLVGIKDKAVSEGRITRLIRDAQEPIEGAGMTVFATAVLGAGTLFLNQQAYAMVRVVIVANVGQLDGERVTDEARWQVRDEMATYQMALAGFLRARLKCDVITQVAITPIRTPYRLDTPSDMSHVCLPVGTEPLF